MDRFFAKVEVGKYVRRVNWSVTTNAELYAAGTDTTHAHEGDEIEELDSIDVDKVNSSDTGFWYWLTISDLCQM